MLGIDITDLYKFRTVLIGQYYYSSPLILYLVTTQPLLLPLPPATHVAVNQHPVNVQGMSGK